MFQRVRIATVFLTLLCGILAWFPVGSGYTSDAAIIAEYSALEPPRFEISIHHGQLRIGGHTASSAHERQLAQAADRSFPNLEATTHFRPLGMSPRHWPATTVALLSALAATQSSSAVLTDKALAIRGVGSDDWHTKLQMLRASLQEGIDIEVDMVVPDAAIRAADICERAFAAYQPGPVNFEESGTTMRSSAYGVLDRTISLANACRSSTLVITGHTDSSGTENWNRRLSLARAQTVADYVAERGVARERLLVIGAGSSAPIADNATRYGRSLNRRISIVLHNDRPAGQT